MFAQWVTTGVGIGVTIYFAAFTVAVLAGFSLAIVRAGVKVMKEADNAERRRSD